VAAPVEVLTLVLFVAGFPVLLGGGELLVRGASRLAAGLGVAPLLIGLTVVAYGTSAPELAVGLQAARAGQGDLTLGNVVGSNIANVLLILGAAASVTPLVVAQRMVRLEVPLLIAASVLTLGFALDGQIGRVEGLALVAGAGAYTVVAVVLGRREGPAVREEYAAAFGGGRAAAGRAVAPVGLLVVGLVLLVVGARWLVDGAVALARLAGLSELLIGLTVVAVGTSLPELATCVLAAVRGERDIAVGNVLGSSLFNLLGVLGLAAALAPAGVAVPAAALHFDLPVMVATAVACLPVFFVGHAVSRWEGLLFLAYYAAYVLFLGLDATQHGGLATFAAAMGWFVLPLTGVTLAVRAGRAWRRTRAPQAPA
jgi:cation:H+ antiporter